MEKIMEKMYKKIIVKGTSKEGAKELLSQLDKFDEKTVREVLRGLLMYNVESEPGRFTPPSRWLVEGTEDPNSEYGSKERADLAYGNLTDDELANAVFLAGDDLTWPLGGIAVLTAGKERIRWLSRKLISLEDQLKQLKADS